MTSPTQPLVLIVDDYEDAREMYAEFLSFSGYRTAEAKNGVEAIEQAVKLTPDVILMDLTLPVMDGWEASARLKDDARTRNIPLVALSGHQLVNGRADQKQVHCDGFLTKPALPDDVLSELKRRPQRRRRVAPAQPTQKAAQCPISTFTVGSGFWSRNRRGSERPRMMAVA